MPAPRAPAGIGWHCFETDLPREPMAGIDDVVHGGPCYRDRAECDDTAQASTPSPHPTCDARASASCFTTGFPASGDASTVTLCFTDDAACERGRTEVRFLHDLEPEKSTGPGSCGTFP